VPLADLLDRGPFMLKHRFVPLLLALAASGLAHAHGGAPAMPVPAELAAGAKAPADAVDLKFAEMFRLPVGPKGLEPSAKLLSLAGKSVRIVGYMANAELPQAGRLILAPLPVTLGDEDESLSDDLPASAVFVHLSASHADHQVPNLRGLMQLSGKLDVGALDEPDGHVSSVRLLLDDASSKKLVDAAARATAALNRQP
jgi:hypothetical protein